MRTICYRPPDGTERTERPAPAPEPGPAHFQERFPRSMSMSRYLWTVAHDLRAYVHPALEGGVAQDTLTNAIRILTAVANAMEAEPAPELAAPAGLAAELVDSDRLI